jgi:hypothetical protein
MHQARQLFIDGKVYRKGLVVQRAQDGGWIEDAARVNSAVKDAAKSLFYKACPWCISSSMSEKQLDNIKGDARHVRFYGNAHKIKSVRETMLDKLEEKLALWTGIAKAYGDHGEEIFLQQLGSLRQQLDASPYYNVSCNDQEYCRTMGDNSPVILSQHE